MTYPELVIRLSPEEGVENLIDAVLKSMSSAIPLLLRATHEEDSRVRHSALVVINSVFNRLCEEERENVRERYEHLHLDQDPSVAAAARYGLKVIENLANPAPPRPRGAANTITGFYFYVFDSDSEEGRLNPTQEIYLRSRPEAWVVEQELSNPL